MSSEGKTGGSRRGSKSKGASSKKKSKRRVLGKPVVAQTYVSPYVQKLRNKRLAPLPPLGHTQSQPQLGGHGGHGGHHGHGHDDRDDHDGHHHHSHHQLGKQMYDDGMGYGDGGGRSMEFADDSAHGHGRARAARGPVVVPGVRGDGGESGQGRGRGRGRGGARGDSSDEYEYDDDEDRDGGWSAADAAAAGGEHLTGTLANLAVLEQQLAGALDDTGEDGALNGAADPNAGTGELSSRRGSDLLDPMYGSMRGVAAGGAGGGGGGDRRNTIPMNGITEGDAGDEEEGPDPAIEYVDVILSCTHSVSVSVFSTVNYKYRPQARIRTS
jgi:hypothetical protein